MRPPRLALTLAALIFPFTLPAVAQEMIEAPPPPLRAGTPAPAFSTKTLQGKPLSLQSLRGRVVLLDFWATWCGPCHFTIPTMRALHRQFGGRGLVVVGMSLDDADTIPQVKPYIRTMHVTYPITVSPAANARAQRVYHADILPAQFLIDKRGIVRWSQIGYSPDDRRELAARIRRLLAEARRR